MTTAEAVDGVLPVDKPPGPTSHDVVAIARRALGTRRIGHTGTLDPFASGLLLLCTGSSTRIVEYVTAMDKRYTATVRLGVSTDTDDHTGSVLAEAATATLTRSMVDAALDAQRGRILQRPPAYSAKKRGGERAHVAARAGRALELEPVPVRIDRLDVTRFDVAGANGVDVELDVVCSSGTYIRAIARDLGEALGVGGHLSSLRRTAIGAYDVAAALPLASLDDAAAVSAATIDPLAALGAMPRVDLSAEDAVDVRHGRQIRAMTPAGTVALALDGRLLGIGVADGVGTVRPRKVLS